MKNVSLPGLPVTRVRHRHRFGGGGPLVEQRRVRDVQTREIHHHRLEGQQRLEPSLRDFGLIRRVRRVPAGILENVALDDRRRDAVVVAEPDVRPRDLVAAGDFAQTTTAPRARTSACESSSGRFRRIPDGTVASIRASSES